MISLTCDTSTFPLKLCSDFFLFNSLVINYTRKDCKDYSYRKYRFYLLFGLHRLPALLPLEIPVLMRVFAALQPRRYVVFHHQHSTVLKMLPFLHSFSSIFSASHSLREKKSASSQHALIATLSPFLSNGTKPFCHSSRFVFFP